VGEECFRISSGFPSGLFDIPSHPIVNILIVEDEGKVAQALKQGLEREGYSVTVARTGEEGYFLLDARTFDLVVLDLMLPGRSGLEILATLRSRDRGIPVLILTARDTVQDRVSGLDTGADDYLVKPFAFPELAARIRALLRRGRSEPPSRLRLADLELDVTAHKVTRAGRDIDLTAREFDLLEYLLRNSGRVVSREMLAAEVWKETARATPIDNVIDVHIARLRRKVDDASPAKLIHTVRGVGFIVREEGA
jgi:two-component system copper resistance phosphate regulon response regulator CusR